MDGQERSKARLSRIREHERRNHALESAEERETRLARRRVSDRALWAAQCTTQQEEALQRRKERGFCAEFTYVRTRIRPRTYTFVRPHMRGHEQHLQTRSGSPHNAGVSLVYLAFPQVCRCSTKEEATCCQWIQQVYSRHHKKVSVPFVFHFRWTVNGHKTDREQTLNGRRTDAKRMVNGQWTDGKRKLINGN